MKRFLLVIVAVATMLQLTYAQDKDGGKKHKKEAQETTLQAPKYTDEFLDTVQIKKNMILNDYSLIGVEYGISQSYMLFTPDFRRKPVRFPDFYGVTFTRYGKMVGTMPYFGFQVGAFYGHEGYEFKEDKETGRINVLENATKVTYDVIEVPLLIAGHLDMTHAKLMLDLGPYAGYRLNIHRSGPFDIDPKLVNGFADYDRRIEYGLNAGVGAAAVFDPIEFHIKLRARYSWSNIFEPDYASPYYYRYGYPLDFMLTAGIHFQLTKRYGKTKSMLRREARDKVYHPENIIEQEPQKQQQ